MQSQELFTAMKDSIPSFLPSWQGLSLTSSANGRTEVIKGNQNYYITANTIFICFILLLAQLTPKSSALLQH